MKIHLTNDDGIYAKGLWALYDRLSMKHSLTIVAPASEKSAVGHGLTLHRPLRVKNTEIFKNKWGYSVNGTPVDCIKLSILEILNEKPDMVISGINPGANTGVNINYSGTVAAAREAALYGITSIAVSMQGKKPEHYDDAAAFIEKLAENIYKKPPLLGTVINVNIPDLPKHMIAGTKIIRQSMKHPEEYVKKNVDPRGSSYFWHGINSKLNGSDPDSDEDVLLRNYIAITPVKCDTTDYSIIDEMNNWEIDKCLGTAR